MTTRTTKFFALAAASAILLGAAGPAAAETMRTEGPMPSDPLMSWADQMLPRNEFALTSDQDIELVRFTTPRDIEICAARSNPDSIDGNVNTVPIQVSWDSDVGTIWPGNCLAFDAKQVKIKPAGPLPDNSELIGTVRVIH